MLIKSLLIIVFSIFSPCYGGVFLHATVSLCSLFSTFLSSTMSLEERLEDLSLPEDERRGSTWMRESLLHRRRPEWLNSVLWAGFFHKELLTLML